MKWETPDRLEFGTERTTQRIAWVPERCMRGVTVWLRPIEEKWRWNGYFWDRAAWTAEELAAESELTFFGQWRAYLRDLLFDNDIVRRFKGLPV